MQRPVVARQLLVAQLLTAPPERPRPHGARPACQDAIAGHELAVVREVPKIEVEEVVREVVKLNKEVRERTVEVLLSFFELPEKTPVA